MPANDPSTTPGRSDEALDRVPTPSLPLPCSASPSRERDHGPVHPPASPRELPDPPRPDSTNTGNNSAPEADGPPDRDRARPAGKDLPWTPRPTGAQIPTDALHSPSDDVKADIASMESFPASDPPAIGGSTQ